MISSDIGQISEGCHC